MLPATAATSCHPRYWRTTAAPRTLRTLPVVVLLCGVLRGALPSVAAAEEPPAENAAAAPASLTFEQHVRPILKAHCFQCHGEEQELRGGLDVRLVRLMLQGGDSGAAIAAGHPEQSLLWQRVASDEMPAGAKKLSAAEKQTLQTWIAQGARTARPEPENAADARYTAEELSFWAFQPVRAVMPPQPDGYLLQSPIDGFLAAELQRNNLPFSAAADRATLLRRLSFDLTGLPPTPEEVAEFVNDSGAGAVERVVDRLLASPQYGVRWGRHWLDVAGYAETDGNPGKDQPRPYAWHYRDYVIQSFNDDKPYDQFLIEQLAGDELLDGPADGNNPRHVELLAATGFLRMAPDVTSTDNTLMDRNQAVADMLKVVSSTVLGLTVGCAQCHDHRYDPISAEDYYRLRAVFDPAFPLQAWTLPAQRLTDLTDDATRAELARIEADAVALEQDLNTRRRAHCQMLQDRAINQAPEAVRERLRAAVNTEPAQQTPEQKQLLDQYPTVRTIDWIVGQLIEYDMPAYRRFEEEQKKIAELRETKPLPRLVMTVKELDGPLPDSRVFFRGNPEQPGQPVQPGELYVLTQARPGLQISSPPAAQPSSGRRLAYARQLVDGTHPLVARVAVNRIWMHHFGRGLVGTPGDFGAFGERPTHPELLDWLAEDFVRHGWRLKRLHKLIVLSTAWQQLSRRTPAQDAVDPDNRLLGRMSLRRLEAEAVRDAILTVTGQLNPALGGPSVPVGEDGEGKGVIGRRLLRDGLFAGIGSVGDQEFRRSVFISSPRSLPLNMLETFDLPALVPNCSQRTSSTAAPQALWFLNDESMVRMSEQMADMLYADPTVTVDPTVTEIPAVTAAARLRLAFLRLFAHPPTDAELQQCQTYLDAQTKVFLAHPDKDWQARLTREADAAERRALASLCQILMSSNRFLYVE